MTVQIRRNVFETNSSSSHSVSYSKPQHGAEMDFDAIQKEIGNRTYGVQFDGFGWGITTLWSFEEKLAYVLTTIAVGLDNARELAESQTYKWLADMLRETVNIQLEIPNPDLTDMGYIDHQSQGMLDDEGYWGNTEGEFKSNVCTLLFSDHIGILIDNDNH